MNRHPATPPRARHTPSATANVEIADGPHLVGAFGDYIRQLPPEPSLPETEAAA